MDITPELNRRTEELRPAGLTLQPIPVFVGPLTAIRAAFVIVNNVQYQVESALHAIQLCIHIFFALDCAYPLNSYTLWLFIQKTYFDINLSTDVCNRSLNTLIGELQDLI